MGPIGCLCSVRARASCSILSSLWRKAFPCVATVHAVQLLFTAIHSLLHGLRMVQQIFVRLDSDSEDITTCSAVIGSTSAFFVSMMFLAIRAFSCVENFAQVDKNLEASHSRTQSAY